MSAARGLTPGKEWAIMRKKQEVADMGRWSWSAVIQLSEALDR
jgi:hypothetical protein